jgi:CHAD domain-containing protein
MAASFIERERKFEVPADFEVPDLQGVVPPGAVLERSVQRLRSDYYDTADHAVRRAGMTLRRRTGTDDVGWHLKLPHGEHREELHFDLSDEVPSGVARLLLGVTRGAALDVVASLETERHVTRVVDTAGDTVADIDLDHVTATARRTSGVSASSWTELEVELGSPSVSDEQLSVLGRRLRDAGARPSRTTSKLARAMGETGPAVGRGGKPKPKGKGKRKSKAKQQRSGAVLLPYLAEQQRMLLLGDVALRRGDDSAIHRTRVATRRLRSALRVFGAFFDAERTGSLDAELRWYAEVLGAVRDSQVLELRLHEALAELPAELILGPVQQHVDAHLHATRQRDWERLQQELSGTRYLDLLAEVAAWIDATPFTGRADRPASALVRASRRAHGAVARRLKAANRSGDVDQLHRARKAAKRARYAAEAAGPVTGSGAIREADRYRRLQDLLGEHQDSVVSAQLLRELGAAAGATGGENGFTFGLLHEREQQRAAAARRKAQRAARRYR